MKNHKIFSYSKETVQRKWPINLRRDDKKLFSVERRKVFKQISSRLITKLYVTSSGICFKHVMLFDLFVPDLYGRRRALVHLKLTIKSLIELLTARSTKK